MVAPFLPGCWDFESFPKEMGISWLSPTALALSLFVFYSGQAQFEMPYVVRLHNFHQLSAPQPCFTFSHPNRGRFLLGWPLSSPPPHPCYPLHLLWALPGSKLHQVAWGLWSLISHVVVSLQIL